MKHLFLTAALMITGAMSVNAQWYHEPTPNDTLQSVRRLADGSAVFSIYAPHAQKVSVAGDIFSMNPKAPLASETSAVATIGNGDEFFQMKDVPHGAIAQRYYYSKNLKTTRRLHVWTPAGYEKSTENLPVLYLIHGGGDTDNAWSVDGRHGNFGDDAEGL